MNARRRQTRTRVVGGNDGNSRIVRVVDYVPIDKGTTDTWNPKGYPRDAAIFGLAKASQFFSNYRNVTILSDVVIRFRPLSSSTTEGTVGYCINHDTEYEVELSGASSPETFLTVGVLASVARPSNLVVSKNQFQTDGYRRGKGPRLVWLTQGAGILQVEYTARGTELDVPSYEEILMISTFEWRGSAGPHVKTPTAGIGLGEFPAGALMVGATKTIDKLVTLWSNMDMFLLRLSGTVAKVINNFTAELAKLLGSSSGPVSVFSRTPLRDELKLAGPVLSHLNLLDLVPRPWPTSGERALFPRRVSTTDATSP